MCPTAPASKVTRTIISSGSWPSTCRVTPGSAGSAGACWPRTIIGAPSEREPHSQLQPPHRAGRADHAERGRRRAGRHGVARLTEIDDVEHVRALGPERQLFSAAQLEVARQRQIDDAEARAVEEIARRVA